MAHIRMVGAQREGWVNTKKLAASSLDTRFRDALVSVGPICGRSAKKSMRLASSNLDCAAVERWCKWFGGYRASLQNAGDVALDVVDLSNRSAMMDPVAVEKNSAAHTRAPHSALRRRIAPRCDCRRGGGG